MQKEPTTTAAHEIMVKINEFKTLLDKHGIGVVSRLNRQYLKEYLEIVIINIENEKSV